MPALAKPLPNRVTGVSSHRIQKKNVTVDNIEGQLENIDRVIMSFYDSMVLSVHHIALLLSFLSEVPYNNSYNY